jgi:hypothetical protein
MTGANMLGTQLSRLRTTPGRPLQAWAALQVLQQDEDDDCTRDAYQTLLDLRNEIFDDPGHDLGDWAKKLRQANFKQQYKIRQGKDDLNFL